MFLRLKISTNHICTYILNLNITHFNYFHRGFHKCLFMMSSTHVAITISFFKKKKNFKCLLIDDARVWNIRQIILSKLYTRKTEEDLLGLFNNVHTRCSIRNNFVLMRRLSARLPLYIFILFINFFCVKSARFWKNFMMPEISPP